MMKKALIVQEKEELVDVYKSLILALQYTPVVCKELKNLFELIDSEFPDMIFWIHGSRETSEDIRYLEKLYQLYKRSQRPKVVVVVAQKNVYAELEALADLVIEKLILDWPSFKNQIETLLEET